MDLLKFAAKVVVVIAVSRVLENFIFPIKSDGSTNPIRAYLP